MSASHGKIQEKPAGKLAFDLKERRLRGHLDVALKKNTHGKSGYQLKWSGQRGQSRASRTS
jgi:hypothetical protein